MKRLASHGFVHCWLQLCVCVCVCCIYIVLFCAAIGVCFRYLFSSPCHINAQVLLRHATSPLCPRLATLPGCHMSSYACPIPPVPCVWVYRVCGKPCVCVYHVCVCVCRLCSQMEWAPWSDFVEEYVAVPIGSGAGQTPFMNLMVQSSDSHRMTFIMKSLATVGRHTLLVGGAGTSLSILFAFIFFFFLHLLLPSSSFLFLLSSFVCSFVH